MVPRARIGDLQGYVPTPATRDAGGKDERDGDRVGGCLQVRISVPVRPHLLQVSGESARTVHFAHLPRTRMQQDIPPSIKQWTALLSISNRFFFEDIRDRAFQALNTAHMDPVERILLARKFDVDAWTVPALCDLCQREDFISEEDARGLGISMTVKLAKIRESVRRELSLTARMGPGFDTWVSGPAFASSADPVESSADP